MLSSTSSQLRPKLRYKLIALDIDGTLLNEKKEITLANLKALQAFKAAGGKVILTSGRISQSTLWHAELLDLTTPFVALNGALVCSGRAVWFSYPFTTETVLECLEYCRKKNIYCHIYTAHEMIYDTPARWNAHWSKQNLAQIEGQSIQTQLRLRIKEYSLARRVVNLAETVQTEKLQIFKMAMLSERSLAGVASDLGRMRGLTVTSSDPRNLEMCPVGVSKGTALRQVTQMMGVQSSEIMAIGDNYNDLSLFEVAGLGVAMGNAPEQVRHSAHVVTDSNNDSGVAVAIMRWAFWG